MRSKLFLCESVCVCLCVCVFHLKNKLYCIVNGSCLIYMLLLQVQFWSLQHIYLCDQNLELFTQLCPLLQNVMHRTFYSALEQQLACGYCKMLWFTIVLKYHGYTEIYFAAY